ncbi:uncharacterized protein LOC129757500 [Uranotaenia lowii]|uniref:uncharacterized protein LOC129751018 n=1 Tax=Uranotaenia lowii TaxID=190385 RepID=UPI002478EC0E|nr:uncharacterized protein LOC129751018 [Uranotaenia lowii]XP_055610739.1 uncharacterized protein LOC129757500 [Uranotaenia lowii]
MTGTDDDNWSMQCCELDDLIPAPEELEAAYVALEAGTYALELNWKCPGRRPPSPVQKDEPKSTEVTEKETPTKNKEFDFMDDVGLPQMRVRNQNTGPKGSAKKKTTNFAGVLDQMKKHGRLTPMKEGGSPNPPSGSAGSGTTAPPSTTTT